MSAARVASLVKGNDWHRKNGGKHVSAAPVSFEKSSHPSRDTQRSSWGRCNHTATSHSLSFSELRRGTSASPLPSRTSRRRSQALKGHARGTRGRHTMRLSHRASHARPPSTPVNPPARQGARCLSAPAFSERQPRSAASSTPSVLSTIAKNCVHSHGPRTAGRAWNPEQAPPR